MKLERAEIERILATWPVARLATLARGRRAPELVPIVFARERRRALVADRRQAQARRRARAPAQPARATRACACLLDRYDADWEQLWWLRLDGRGGAGRCAATASAAVAALRAKYPRYASGATRALRGRADTDPDRGGAQHRLARFC